MRPLIAIALLAPLALAACDHDRDRDRDKTVIVNPPSNTVVQPAPAAPGSTVKVCPNNAYSC